MKPQFELPLTTPRLQKFKLTRGPNASLEFYADWQYIVCQMTRNL